MRNSYKLIVILLSIFILNLMFPIRVNCQTIKNLSLLPDNFIATIEEWERVGADYQIDSNDNDTSYIRFQYPHTNELKTLSYFSFEDITIPSEPQGFNVTSIISVTVRYRFKVEVPGEWFRFSGYYWNGSTWIKEPVDWTGTSVATYQLSSPINLTEILDTPQKVENARVYFRNPGGVTWEDPGRITYVYLDVWFTYEGIYVYPLRLILGLIGLAIMIISPTIGVREVLKEKNWEMIGGCAILFVIGYALVIVWLIP